MWNFTLLRKKNSFKFVRKFNKENQLLISLIKFRKRKEKTIQFSNVASIVVVPETITFDEWVVSLISERCVIDGPSTA